MVGDEGAAGAYVFLGLYRPPVPIFSRTIAHVNDHICASSLSWKPFEGVFARFRHQMR